MLRILAIAPTSFFADYGCHVRIWGHLNALIRRGHEVRLVTYPSGRERAPISTVRPRLFRHWPLQVGASWHKIVLDAALAPLVVRVALAFRPHLVHAFLHEGVALALPVRAAGVPVVFDYQGSLTAEMITHGFLAPGSPAAGVWRFVERFLDRHADAIVASTRQAVAHLCRQYGLPASRVRHVPDSVDPTVFRPPRPEDAASLAALRRRWRLPSDRPIIAYLGLLAPYQGVDVLLEAHRRLLRRRWSRPPFLLVMGFPFVERYRRRATRLGLADHVRFTGPVPYDRAPEALRLAQVAVAPKLPGSEGAGKLLPYMATALPVVASDTPVHRAYLGDAGYYARPGDAADLADRLAEALTDPDAPARGRRLRARVEAHFTWDHAGERLVRVYADLLRRP